MRIAFLACLIGLTGCTAVVSDTAWQTGLWQRDITASRERALAQQRPLLVLSLLGDLEKRL